MKNTTCTKFDLDDILQGFVYGAEQRNANRLDLEQIECWKNEPTVAIGGVDTEENEPRQDLKLISSADVIISIVSLRKGRFFSTARTCYAYIHTRRRDVPRY